MPLAARVSDLHVCLALTPGTPPIPHVGGTIQPPCAPNTKANSQALARATDMCTCVGGPPNFIVTGSESVLIGGLPAARSGDKTMHPPPGAVVLGSPDVLIGGATVGATLGGAASAKAACEAAKATRHTPGKDGQSYGNCGLEAWRTAINADRARRGLPPMSEDDLMKLAQDLHAAGNDPVGKPWSYGATTVDQRVQILGDPSAGVAVAPGASDPASIQQMVAERRAMSATVHPIYWPGATDANKGWVHEVSVTGVVYGKDGKPELYIINDTGLGVCGLEVPAKDFEAALYPGAATTVSRKPVW